MNWRSCVCVVAAIVLSFAVGGAGAAAAANAAAAGVANLAAGGAARAAAFGAASAGAAAGATAAPLAPQQQAQLLAIQQDWARITYQVTGDDRKSAEFAALAQRAAAFASANPGRAEPLIWHGIVLSTWAGAKGGLGALSLCKQAREKLEAALQADPAALDGSAYTSLGTLYYKVPGFPLGFGDHKKARQLLESALRVSPAGIDSNFFYGEFLVGEDRYAEAVTYLNRALAAAPRPNREVADRGRRAEIEALLSKARAKLG